jgi:hypothetical protein
MDGTEVHRGDVLVSFRGEQWVFESCTHPRKINVHTVEIHSTTYGGDRHLPGEFYPTVFDVRIEDSNEVSA